MTDQERIDKAEQEIQEFMDEVSADAAAAEDDDPFWYMSPEEAFAEMHPGGPPPGVSDEDFLKYMDKWVADQKEKASQSKQG